MKPENLRRRDLSFEGLKLLENGKDTGWSLVKSEKHTEMYLIDFGDGGLSYSSYNLTRAKDNILDYYLAYAHTPRSAPADALK